MLSVPSPNIANPAPILQIGAPSANAVIASEARQSLETMIHPEGNRGQEIAALRSQ
jgi:hypothetical protein